MTEIVPIRKPFAPDDIPSTLRRIADEVEGGKHGLQTTCIVVLGHTESRPADNGDMIQSDDYVMFGAGPRCDIFTTRGLLLTVATQPLS